MSLPITPHQFSKRPALSFNSWPRQGPNILKEAEKNVKKVVTINYFYEKIGLKI